MEEIFPFRKTHIRRSQVSMESAPFAQTFSPKTADQKAITSDS